MALIRKEKTHYFNCCSVSGIFRWIHVSSTVMQRHKIASKLSMNLTKHIPPMFVIRMILFPFLNKLRTFLLVPPQRISVNPIPIVGTDSSASSSQKCIPGKYTNFRFYPFWPKTHAVVCLQITETKCRSFLTI